MTEDYQWWPRTSIIIGLNGAGYPVYCFKEGANTTTYGEVYVVVVQYVLFLGSYSWVVTSNILGLIGILHNWVA